MSKYLISIVLAWPTVGTYGTVPVPIPARLLARLLAPATRSAVWPLSALRFVWRLPDHLTRSASSPLDAAGICDLAHASTSRLSEAAPRAYASPASVAAAQFRMEHAPVVDGWGTGGVLRRPRLSGRAHRLRWFAANASLAACWAEVAADGGTAKYYGSLRLQ